MPDALNFARDVLHMVAVGIEAGRIRAPDVELLYADGTKRVSVRQLALDAMQGLEAAIAARVPATNRAACKVGGDVARCWRQPCADAGHCTAEWVHPKPECWLIEADDGYKGVTFVDPATGEGAYDGFIVTPLVRATLGVTAAPAPYRCIKPQCPNDCCDCNHAIPGDDAALVLIADLLDHFAVDGHGGPLEDGESAMADRARKFLAGARGVPPKPVA
jgi:hypothetical protein